MTNLGELKSNENIPGSALVQTVDRDVGTGSQNLGTAYAAVTGISLTLPAGIWAIYGIFDFGYNDSGPDNKDACYFEGQLLSNGVAIGSNATMYAPVISQMRMTEMTFWAGLLLTSFTFSLQARANKEDGGAAAAGTATLNRAGSGLLVWQIG